MGLQNRFDMIAFLFIFSFRMLARSLNRQAFLDDMILFKIHYVPTN